MRTSDTGVTLIGWDDVARIRTYTKGFMMVLKRGTLPIPFRCLSRGRGRCDARDRRGARGGRIAAARRPRVTRTSAAQSSGNSTGISIDRFLSAALAPS